MSPDPPLYDIERPYAPPWLIRFVHEEVRPVLRDRRRSIIAAWDRWLVAYLGQREEHEEWEARHEAFETYHARCYAGLYDPTPHLRLTDDGNPHDYTPPTPPPEPGCEPHPAELPLPLTFRDLSPDEAVVVMAVVHDAVRHRPEEWVGPSASDLSECSIIAAVLRREVKVLTESDLSELRRILGAVAACPPDAADAAPVAVPPTLAVEQAEPTHDRKDWEALGIGYMFQGGDSIKSIEDLWKVMQERGYPRTRPSLYNMPKLLHAAEAKGIYSPKKDRPGHIGKGFKTPDGRVEVEDTRTAG